METTIRPATNSDHDEIRLLLLEAFPTAVEADLVEQLRADGDVVYEVVAVSGSKIAGHVLFSRMDAPFSAIGLAPVATALAHRCEGIAAALIRHSLDLARDDCWIAAFVLGDPAYYRRFGFSAELAAGFTSPYSGPYLMAQALQEDPLPALAGKVDYANAFAGLA